MHLAILKGDRGNTAALRARDLYELSSNFDTLHMTKAELVKLFAAVFDNTNLSMVMSAQLPASDPEHSLDRIEIDLKNGLVLLHTV